MHTMLMYVRTPPQVLFLSQKKVAQAVLKQLLEPVSEPSNISEEVVSGGLDWRYTCGGQCKRKELDVYRYICARFARKNLVSCLC